MMYYQSTASWMRQTKKIWRIFPVENLPQTFSLYSTSFHLSDLLKRKWDWYITSNILQTTVARKKKPSESSQQHSGVVSCSQTRQAAFLHICVICLTVHIQLTSGSAFISGNVIGTGSSSSSASETASAFTFMAWFASWGVGYVSAHGPTKAFSKFVQFCKNHHILLRNGCTTPHIKQRMLSLLWIFLITSNS